MALTGHLIRDQNLKLNFDGSVGGNMKADQPQKKGMFGARKPLGDLSNHAPNKQTSRNFSLLDEEIESSKIKSNANEKITSSIKASGKKLATTRRKALSDISNSKKLNIAPEASKTKTTKLSVLAEDMDDIQEIADEGFLHNHHECIQQQARVSATDMDHFLKTLGLNKNNDHSYQLSSPWISAPRILDLEPESPPRYLKGEEEYDISPHKGSTGHDSPISFWSPESSELHTEWMELDVNFTLAASPNR